MYGKIINEYLSCRLKRYLIFVDNEKFSNCEDLISLLEKLNLHKVDINTTYDENDFGKGLYLIEDTEYIRYPFNIFHLSNNDESMLISNIDSKNSYDLNRINNVNIIHRKYMNKEYEFFRVDNDSPLKGYSYFISLPTLNYLLYSNKNNKVIFDKIFTDYLI